MELVANVWPVVDIGTGIVERYFMRAYALDVEDQIISSVLNALAPTDFRIARDFKIPPQFKVTSEHGTMDGTVQIGVFQREVQRILEEGYKTLEKDYLKVQGIDMSSGTPRLVTVIPRFPDDPYTLITVLVETQDGQLIPQLDR